MAELSGFEVLALLKEIGATLRDAYVNNIYTVGGSHLFRFRKPGSEDVWLVVSPRWGVWPSKGVEERGETGEFTTKLRRELERARFTGASQADLDRVYVLDFEGAEGRRMFVELMPPGNIVVTDAGGEILLALNEVRTPIRRVVRGVSYRSPAQSRISPTDVRSDDVASMLMGEKTAGRAIGRHVALPRKYVSECLSRLGVGDETPSSALEGRESEVVRVLGEMVEDARERPRPCVCETPRGDEIFVFPPRGLRAKESAESVAELCDRLFLKEATTETAPESPSEAKRKEMEVTIARLRSESASLRAEASRVRGAADRAGSSSLGEAVRILGDLRIRLGREPSSPESAASSLFDHAKGLEAKADAATDTARKLEERLPRVERSGAPTTRLLPRRKREWYEKFRWFYTSEGKMAVGGRDAQSNSNILERHLEAKDVVYHADLFGSPFFVLKGGSAQTEEEVRQLAQATVAFSSAWKTGLGSADAYWVRPDQISSAAPSGEYLSRGSFAIRGKKNGVVRVIVEVAAGLDPAGRVMAGPEEAVKSRCGHYLVLRPQNEKGSDTAKRVLKDLTATTGGPPRLVTLDDVQRALPTGGGKIVRRK